MILAFYAVDNSRGYNRDSFMGLNANTILDRLELLPPEEVRCYDMSRFQATEDYPALNAFVEDYNNEELDNGGWWCVAIETDRV